MFYRRDDELRDSVLNLGRADLCCSAVLPSSILQPGWMELVSGAQSRACELHVEREAEGDDKGGGGAMRGGAKDKGRERGI